MKQIKFITVMLLLATLTLSFNACSNDDDDEPYNYQDTLKKYENTIFAGAAWENKIVYFKDWRGSILKCDYSAYEATGYTGYNEDTKQFYMTVLKRYINNQTEWINLIVEFKNDSIINVGGTTLKKVIY
jgi:hypothetical protein